MKERLESKLQSLKPLTREDWDRYRRIKSRTGLAIAQMNCEAVTSWNAAHPVGTAVEVLLDDGSKKQTVSRAPAQMLGGHTAVIWLEGISGAYALSRCRAIV